MFCARGVRVPPLYLINDVRNAVREVVAIGRQVEQEGTDLVDQWVRGTVIAERQGGIAEYMVHMVDESWSSGEADLHGSTDDEAGVAAYLWYESIGVGNYMSGGSVEEKLAEPDAKFKRGLPFVGW